MIDFCFRGHCRKSRLKNIFLLFDQYLRQQQGGNQNNLQVYSKHMLAFFVQVINLLFVQIKFLIITYVFLPENLKESVQGRKFCTKSRFIFCWILQLLLSQVTLFQVFFTNLFRYFYCMCQD